MANVTPYKIFALCIVLMCLWPAKASSQQSIVYRRAATDSTTVPLKTKFNNQATLNEYLLRLPRQLQNQGYLSASVDTVAQHGDTTYAALFIGAKFKALTLYVNHTQPLLRQLGYMVKNGALAIDFDEYKQLQTKVLDFYGNNGYPFASVQLDSVAINSAEITAVLTVQKGNIYRVDSISVSGPARISKNFINHYLDIQPGSLYNANKLEQIDRRLREVPFLQQVQPWNVTMLNTGSIVNLYLDTKKSNQANVLAGFLPANNQLGGKLLLTVDANLQLQNALGTGENLSLIWQQIQPRSPRLHLQYGQPYLFGSPFGIDLLFDLFKRDSSFLNVNAQLGLLYALSPTQSAKFIVQSQQSNVLQVDTISIKNTRQLPDVADVSAINIGFEYTLNKTDYRYNPRQGNEVQFSVTTGTKRIKKNTSITQLKDPFFNFNSLYDSIKLKTYQIRFSASAAHYFSIGKYTVLKTAVNAGLYKSESIFRNEVYRIGGYRLLRGFDEESILTDRYVVTTLEYRYLLGLNSNLFGFTDIGAVHHAITSQSNAYAGAGVGLAIETKGGIFNISYAVGKRNDLPLNLKQSKIHIGFVSIF